MMKTEGAMKTDTMTVDELVREVEHGAVGALRELAERARERDVARERAWQIWVWATRHSRGTGQATKPNLLRDLQAIEELCDPPPTAHEILSRMPEIDDPAISAMLADLLGEDSEAPGE
jgi:hypothetical protein